MKNSPFWEDYYGINSIRKAHNELKKYAEALQISIEEALEKVEKQLSILKGGQGPT